MDLVGVIVAADERSWIEIIQQHASLVPPDPLRAVNPFTRKPIEVAPKPSTARVVVEGSDVGVMRWAKDGTNEILVLGQADLVAPVAREVATLLGARFDETGAS